MRGAIYSRVSTEIQDYGKQTDELKDYAARNNLEVKYIFEEKVSGFKDDRTEFKKLEKLTKNDIDIILVWELSRLSRRSIFIQQTVKNFANKGICIFTKKEGLYTLNDDGTENQSQNMGCEEEPIYIRYFAEYLIKSLENILLIINKGHLSI